MPDTSILKNQNFLLLWSGNAITFVGTCGVRIAYPLMALTLTGSPVAASWVGFAMTLPEFIFQVPSGVAADYRNRRQTLVKCQKYGLMATLLAAVVVVVTPPGLTLLLMVSAFVEGAAQVFFATSELGLVRDIVSVEERPAAFALVEAEESIATVVGRGFGAVALGAARSLPFLANAATYLYALWSLSKIRSSPQEEVHGPSIWDWSSARSGMQFLRADPFLRSIAAILTATNFIFEIVVLLTSMDIRNGGGPVWEIGVVLGAPGLGGIVSAAPTMWLARRADTKIALTITLWAWFLMLVIMAMCPTPAMLAVSLVGIGAFWTFSNVAMTLYRVRVVPEAMLGRVVGATMLVQCSGMAAGSLLAGYILSMLGTSATGWLLVVAMLILALKTRRLEEPAAGLLKEATPAVAPTAAAAHRTPWSPKPRA
ncbi:MFS transporter [Nocardia sp. NEAU-G5]|uniref:MFS transporter n=1 Tax=Nocardia albiluteola TaxID=2842303 RepID=A0ABS6AQW5_9NOCA|nr:MFS transporter [Nocardia albiluteola]MBU3060412.1 MFS transporter [Nocardia albiluteola]